MGVFNRSLSVKLGIFPISCQHCHPIITLLHWFVMHCYIIKFNVQQSCNAELVAYPLMTSKMIYHRGGGGEPERTCIAVLSCTQTMDNSRIGHCLLFHEHGKQKLRAAISPVDEATMLYTHAWTKLSWAESLALMMSLFMVLTWSELNYCVWFDGSVCEQPVLVCHDPQSFSVDPSAWSSLHFSMCANWKSFASVRSI